MNTKADNKPQSSVEQIRNTGKTEAYGAFHCKSEFPSPYF